MSVKFEWHGDKVLREITNKLEKATGRVSLPDLMPAAFMKRHTRFESLNAMLTASALVKEGTTTNELAPILQSPEWNQFVAANSPFGSWQAMIKAAGVERVKRAFGK